MNIFHSMILNIMFITFPMLLYLFYVACSHNLNKKENNLFFELALLTSLYLIISNDYGSEQKVSLVLLNIPLMISYLRNRQPFALIFSVLLIIYYSSFTSINIFIVIFEFVTYYIFNMLKMQQKMNDRQFVNGFILIKCLFITITATFAGTDALLSLAGAAQLVITFGSLYIVSHAVVLLFGWCEEIINLHVTIKELEQEKQIRVSLFKITHEIKNPIAVCKGYLDMFDVKNREHSEKYIPIIKEEIEHTLLLLQDFLEINKTNIEEDLLDINLLLEEVIRHVSPLLKEQRIISHYEIEDDEVFLSGDYNRLRQVLVNVIKNSTEALRNTANPRIDIETKIKGDKIIIAIRDNGEGISKENMKRLTEPFFTTKKKGTGLGVYLSNEIIKAHHGKMQYHSKEGEGTVVSIELPIMAE